MGRRKGRKGGEGEEGWGGRRGGREGEEGGSSHTNTLHIFRHKHAHTHIHIQTSTCAHTYSHARIPSYLLHISLLCCLQPAQQDSREQRSLDGVGECACDGIEREPREEVAQQLLMGQRSNQAHRYEFTAWPHNR